MFKTFRDRLRRVGRPVCGAALAVALGLLPVFLQLSHGCHLSRPLPSCVLAQSTADDEMPGDEARSGGPCFACALLRSLIADDVGETPVLFGLTGETRATLQAPLPVTGRGGRPPRPRGPPDPSRPASA